MINKIKVFGKYRGLLKELVSRDLKTKYRRSILGYVWSVLNPLLMMCVLSVAFATILKQTTPFFAAYLITGQVIFNFYTEATNMAMGSIIQAGPLIKKVYIPKYIFPVSKVLSSLVNLLFSLVAVVIVCIFTGVSLKISMIFAIIPLIYVTLFALGIGMALSSMAVYFRDMIHLYGVAVLAWMYLTPVFYPATLLTSSNATPLMRTIGRLDLKFNPMWKFIDMFRGCIIGNENVGIIPSFHANLVCITMVLISLLFGFVVFYKQQNKFILYI